jgi:hypothetical protein
VVDRGLPRENRDSRPFLAGVESRLPVRDQPPVGRPLATLLSASMSNGAASSE